MSAVEQAVERISAHAEAGAPLGGEFRKRIVPGFPDPLTEFFHDVPQPVIDEAWAQGEPRQSDTVFASRCTFRVWPAVPTRILVGRDDQFFPAEFQLRVARERLGIDVDEMPGGHLVALSQPEELSARLAAYAIEAGAVVR